MTGKGERPEDDILTVDETAHYLKISKYSVYKAIKDGKLPYMTFGQKIRISKEAILDAVGKIKK